MQNINDFDWIQSVSVMSLTENTKKTLVCGEILIGGHKWMFCCILLCVKKKTKTLNEWEQMKLATVRMKAALHPKKNLCEKHTSNSFRKFCHWNQCICLSVNAVDNAADKGENFNKIWIFWSCQTFDSAIWFMDTENSPCWVLVVGSPIPTGRLLWQTLKLLPVVLL